MQWRIGFLIGLFYIASAHAAVVSTDYVGAYFRDMCNNSYLDVPAGGTGIASARYVMGVVDYLNSNTTTYAASLVNDGLAGDAYLGAVLKMMTDSPTCCPGGYYDIGYSECRDCGAWIAQNALPDCTDEGKYRSGTSCATCPSGYTCPAGTNGRFSSKSFLIQCLANGEYRNNNVCTVCTDGYYCPENRNSRENCGAGYYCIAGVKTECEYGMNQCPGTNHATDNEPVACDDAVTLITSALPDCTADGQYRNGTACATCPTDYTCPAGTNGKLSNKSLQ